MARPQAFDTRQVLEDAMQLFWRQGYASTSMRDLTQATRLQPGSLYAAFKNKRQLFLQALDHYSSSLHKAVRERLYAEGPPLQRIRDFFQYLVEQSQRDTEVRGCLLVNTLLEMPADDEEINRHVRNMLQQVEQDFCHVLEEAQAQGDLAADRDPARLARLLITGIFGLRVYNRMHPLQGELQAVVDELLLLLETASRQT